MKIKSILLISIVTLLVIIFLQNMQIVEYKFLFWYLALPKTLFALLFMTIGIMFWFVAKSLMRKRHKDDS